MAAIKASDYIVSFIESKGIHDVFGYPGGMVTHLMDSFRKNTTIHAHLMYHEQAAAMAACGYGQMMKTPTVVFATSGPGATNLITGICNAWFDSIPVIFITGQVNTYEGRNGLPLRQKGFQETDIISIVKSVTKYSVYIEDAKQLLDELNKAYDISVCDRQGPVLLDIPMDVFRSLIDENKTYSNELLEDATCINDLNEKYKYIVSKAISESSRQCIVIGNGVHRVNQGCIIKLIEKLNIPVVTSMPAVDILPTHHPLNFGFIGAYGSRIANTIVAKSDLLITIGTRLDSRQTGNNRDWFATKARIIRFDIDENEFCDKIKSDETQIRCDIKAAVLLLEQIRIDNHADWLEKCNLIKEKLSLYDTQIPNEKVAHISSMINSEYTVTTDVGQNQVWVAQSLIINRGQRVLFSSGFGAMGYSLPAAIGAYMATHRPVISFNGDGGFQMNIQELQTVFREKLPIKIIILNNYSLGMIRHFQDMYFNSDYSMTTENSGYTTPNFYDVAKAYKIPSMSYTSKSNDEEFKELINSSEPCVIVVDLGDKTVTRPKSVFNKPLSYQEPLLDKSMQEWIDAI